jgi:hypothetical protein
LLWGEANRKIITRIFQDVEDLADAEIERLLKHLEIKRNNKINCCY